MSGLDEFGEIARLFRPLTGGAPEALALEDDAAAIPLGDGETLAVTTDTVVEGVHTPLGEAPELIARKLLRVNLSDLAAKGAAPYGWLLNIAWPPNYGAQEREAFARGLAADTALFGLRLLGGDTVRTPGPLTATATLMGRTPRLVPRGGARPGDLLLVSGTIGDATLGLNLVLAGAGGDAFLLERYRLPTPRLRLIPALRGHASAAADVSDGLLADAAHIAEASGLGVEIDLGAVPLSLSAAAWLSTQDDERRSRVRLATGGDDYEIVCACPPEAVAAFRAAAGETPLTVVGRFAEGSGVQVRFRGEAVAVERLGYVHR